MQIQSQPSIALGDKTQCQDAKRGDVHIGWTREQLFDYFARMREQYAREAQHEDRRGGLQRKTIK